MIFSEKELVVQKVLREHKKLHDLLNDLKVKAGDHPDPYTVPDTSKQVKEIFSSYDHEPVTEEEVIQMFNSCGDLKTDYHIIKSKKVCFASEDEAEADEQSFYSKLNFKDTVTVSESRILSLIKKDKRITPEVIAKVLGTSTEYVVAKIAALTKAGILESNPVKIGEDEQIERTLTKPLSEINPPNANQDTEITIKYSYEGPKDDRNRPFCAKMLELDRLYSRAEIERISLRLGYSVFDRRGGWRTLANGEKSPVCRHRWLSNILVRKRPIS